MDSNILAYAEGVDDAARQATARTLLERPQALGELYNVLVRQARLTNERGGRAISLWRDVFPVAPTTEAAMVAAVDLAVDHRLGIWDSIMPAVAGGSRLPPPAL